MVKKLTFALICCLVSSALTFAAPSVYVERIPGYYSGDGGEFRLTPNQDLKDITIEDGPYSSFCLEKNVWIGTGWHDVLVSTQAGGAPLNPMSAYLYTQFRAGTLAGYDYDPLGSRAASAGALQDVIWYIEGQLAMTWTPGDSSLQDQYYTDAQSSGWTDIGDVRVLNLYVQGFVGNPNYARQDQFILVGDVPVIPAPGALILGSLGMGIVGWLRRRNSL